MEYPGSLVAWDRLPGQSKITVQDNTKKHEVVWNTIMHEADPGTNQSIHLFRRPYISSHVLCSCLSKTSFHIVATPLCSLHMA